MISVTFCGETYECAKAIKGSDYIYLLDEDSAMVASFIGITDFSGFIITGGDWTSAKDEKDCSILICGEDGVPMKSNISCGKISAPNLLINSDFSINQNGKTEYQNNGGTGIYGVDRWIIGNNDSYSTKLTKTAVNSVGVTMSKGATATGGHYFLTQYVEDYANLAGKTLTVTVAYKNNTAGFRIQCTDYYVSPTNKNSHSSNNFTSSSGIATFTFTVISNTNQLQIRLQDMSADAMSIEFEYVKLEIGSVATAYVRPIYEEEIWKCNSVYGERLPISNPNIVINSNFAINQRGIYEYSTTMGYMADKWYKQVSTAASVSFSGEECTIKLLADRTSNLSILRQSIEDGYKYIGKTLTLSLDVVSISTTSTTTNIPYYVSISYWNESGGYIAESPIRTMTAGSKGRVSVTTNSVPANTHIIRVAISAFNGSVAGDEFIFKYPKLEIGSVATAYTLPIYSEELLKCQALDTDPVQLLRSTDVSTTYPLSSSAASDSKVLSEKVVFDKVATKDMINTTYPASSTEASDEKVLSEKAVYEAIENICTEDNPVPKAINAINATYTSFTNSTTTRVYSLDVPGFYHIRARIIDANMWLDFGVVKLAFDGIQGTHSCSVWSNKLYSLIVTTSGGILITYYDLSTGDSNSGDSTNSKYEIYATRLE